MQTRCKVHKLSVGKIGISLIFSLFRSMEHKPFVQTPRQWCQWSVREGHPPPEKHCWRMQCWAQEDTLLSGSCSQGMLERSPCLSLQCFSYRCPSDTYVPPSLLLLSFPLHQAHGYIHLQEHISKTGVNMPIFKLHNKAQAMQATQPSCFAKMLMLLYFALASLSSN